MPWTSLSLRVQAISGWRLMVPVAEQGASSNTASKPSSWLNWRRSARTTVACICSRSRLRCSTSRRRPDRSMAVTSAPRAIACAVLPPGAAQASSRLRPCRSPNSRTGRVAAVSCTHHAPSAYPGISGTAAWLPSRTLPVGSSSPPSRSAHPAASSRTVRSSGVGVSSRCAAARALALLRPRCAAQRFQGQSGVSRRAMSGRVSLVAPWRSTLRRMALTTPRNLLPSGSISTCSLTTAWAGLCRKMIWAMPDSRIRCANRPERGRGRSSRCFRCCSSDPLWRSVASAIVWAKRRSRASMPRTVSSSTSSSPADVSSTRDSKVIAACRAEGIAACGAVSLSSLTAMGHGVGQAGWSREQHQPDAVPPVRSGTVPTWCAPVPAAPPPGWPWTGASRTGCRTSSYAAD